MTRKVKIYVKDILDNMERAERFVGTMSREGFMKDEKTCYAVQRCVEIIGEAAKQVPERIRKQYPDIPWREMAGMRDKVIHFYFGVDPEKVWMVVKRDIPMLKPRLLAVLGELDDA